METTTTKNLHMCCGEVTPVEWETSVRVLSNDSIRISYATMKQEAPIGEDAKIIKRR
jgi:hypothetical protein